MYHKVRDNLFDEYKKTEYADTGFTLTILIILLIITLISCLNTFVFFHVKVDGLSMYSTLNHGDVLVANKYKKVEHGSIIIINGEKRMADGSYALLIKRAIALEGDTVQIKNGKVYINGDEIKEPYLDKGKVTDALGFGYKPYTLKKNEVFYLGDNRDNSADSRVYGTCDISQVEGVVENWSLSIRWLNGFIYKISTIFNGEFKGS